VDIKNKDEDIFEQIDSLAAKMLVEEYQKMKNKILNFKKEAKDRKKNARKYLPKIMTEILMDRSINTAELIKEIENIRI